MNVFEFPQQIALAMGFLSYIPPGLLFLFPGRRKHEEKEKEKRERSTKTEPSTATPNVSVSLAVTPKHIVSPLNFPRPHFLMLSLFLSIFRPKPTRLFQPSLYPPSLPALPLSSHTAQPNLIFPIPGMVGSCILLLFTWVLFWWAGKRRQTFTFPFRLLPSPPPFPLHTFVPPPPLSRLHHTPNKTRRLDRQMI